MDTLDSMINRIVRLRPVPLILDKGKPCEPFDVDWFITCSLLQGSKEFEFQTVSRTQGFRLPLKEYHFVSFRPEKSADLKSASEGIFIVNRHWIIFPEGKQAQSVSVSNTLTEHYQKLRQLVVMS